jgi:threonine/homoserine/homoserine lactone efflux protein
MRIDLADLKRLEGIGEGLGRLFWFLIAAAFLAVLIGSTGTGLLVLILGGAAFAGKAGLEDFVRSRRELKKRTAAVRKRSATKKRAATKKLRTTKPATTARSTRRPKTTASR